MIRKIISVFLAFVVLIMTSGFTVSSHICGEEKVKTVFGISHTDVSCGMEEEADNVCDRNDMITSNCCQDELQQIKLDENYTQQFTEVNFNNGFVAVLFTVVFDLFSSEASQEFFYSDYSPPPLVRDIPVLIQSFLI